MKWFKNLKIAKKLVSAFVVVSVLVGIVGMISLFDMNKINSNARSMYEYNLASVEALTTLKQNFADIRADLLKLVYQKNINEKDTIKNDINKLLSSNDKIISTYEKSLLSQSEKGDFSDLKNNFSSYIEVSNSVIKYVDENNYVKASDTFPKVTEERKKYILIWTN